MDGNSESEIGDTEALWRSTRVIRAHVPSFIFTWWRSFAWRCWDGRVKRIFGRSIVLSRRLFAGRLVPIGQSRLWSFVHGVINMGRAVVEASHPPLKSKAARRPETVWGSPASFYDIVPESK